MSTKIRMYKMLSVLLLITGIASAQVATLEMITGQTYGGPQVVSGNGNGPRVTPHVVTLVQDATNNNQYSTFSPTVTSTFMLANQQYTGLTYGASTTNAVPTGLIFGAGPSLSTGIPPQQASPVASYNFLGTYGSTGGPTNAMFTNIPPSGPGGIDCNGDAFGNDINAGVEVFTCSQILYDQVKPNGSTDKYYYGDLVISFNRYVSNPVLHIAGLGGSYRYLPQGATDIPANYKSTYFSTELQLASTFSMSKLAGNNYLDVSGNQILNNAAIPNGGSAPNPATDPFNNYGAATGSIRINGVMNSITLKVFIRGCTASDFGWSSAGIGVVSQATRAPLTGDIWYIGVSVEREALITLPATGVHLNAALNNNNVSLSWVTESELNSKEFEIERSTDGVKFTQIAVKNAAGNSYSRSNYSYIDDNMNVSIYYYRLKLVDVDGKGTYSNIAMVRKPGGIRSVKVFPNPVVDHLNLEFSNAQGNYDIVLYSQMGQQLLKQKVNILSTVQYVNLSKGNLPAGSYILSIKNNATSEKYDQNLIFIR